MKSQIKKQHSIFLALCGALILGGCALASIPELKPDTARRLASAAWMVERDIPAGAFRLRGYERMHERNAPANIYIEGDGSLSFSKSPTPRNPVALHLATKDKAENVVYLARPCQYIGQHDEGTACKPALWNEKRYNQNVIESYDAALDEIAKRYDLTGFHLIGYDGGAAVAMLIAKERRDILSVRTVAGVLDHQALSALSNRAPLTGSLNPADYATDLASMPQMHFVGAQDTVIPPAILGSYLQASPPSRCVQSMLVQEAAHDKGWVDKWPELLSVPVNCFAREPSGFAEYAVDGKKPPSTKFVPLPNRPEKP